MSPASSPIHWKPQDVGSKGCSLPETEAFADSSYMQLKRTSDSNRRSSGTKSEEDVEIPDWYRVEGSSTKGVQLLPDYALYVSLKGGNGAWTQRKANIAWRYQVAEHRSSEAQRIREEKRARIAKREAEAKRRLEQEELRKKLEQDAERRKREQAEWEEAERRRKEEEELQAKLLAEKREKMHKPRPCKTCDGTGKCNVCDGKGDTLTLYLSPRVTHRSVSVCGQLPKGCPACGGSGDGAWWGEFIQGSGACQSCGGKGDVPAPPNGWPDCLA